MKKCYLIYIAMQFFAFSVITHAMAPGQIAQEIRSFRRAIAEYKKLSQEGKGLTPEALKLKSSAEASIAKIKPFTTTKVLENELQNIAINAETISQKTASNTTDLLVQFLGKQQSVGDHSNRNMLKTKSSSEYFQSIANNVMSDGYAILARLYPTNNTSTLDLVADEFSKRNFLITLPSKRKRPYEYISYSNSLIGGGLYLINKAMDRVYTFLNCFGAPKESTFYGQGNLKNFNNSKDLFLKALTETFNNIDKAKSFLNQEKPLLTELKKYTEKYDTFIHQIMKVKNINEALKKIQNVFKSFKIEYPNIDGNRVLQDKKVLTLKELNKENGFFQSWEYLVDSLKGEIKNNIEKKTKILFEADHTKQINFLLEENKKVENQIEIEKKLINKKLKAAEKTTEFLTQLETEYKKIPEDKRPKDNNFKSKRDLKKWINSNNPWVWGNNEIADFVKKIGQLALENMGAVKLD